MSTKGAAIIGACIIVAGLILGTTLPARSQAPASHTSADLQIGRFQIAGVPGHAYVLDTATGQVWEAFATTGSGHTDQDFKAPKLKPKAPPVPPSKDHSHDHHGHDHGG